MAGGWLAGLRREAGPAHLELGRRGERQAARMLRRSGYRVLAANLETPGGEADLVCRERRSGVVVLVEVKSRVRVRAGEGVPATAAINADKRRRLVETARALAGHPRVAGHPVRIDVVTVEYRGAGDRRPDIRHFVNAVGADGALR